MEARKQSIIPLAKGEAKATGSQQTFRGTTTDNEHRSVATFPKIIYHQFNILNTLKQCFLSQFANLFEKLIIPYWYLNAELFGVNKNILFYLKLIFYLFIPKTSFVNKKRWSLLLYKVSSSNSVYQYYYQIRL